MLMDQVRQIAVPGYLEIKCPCDWNNENRVNRAITEINV